MRKLFKKSLACVLAVALCLTAMVGVLSVSADVVGTLTMVGFNGVVGDTATVTATFAAPDGELISESFIDVAVSNGAKVESVALAGANDDNGIELNDAKTRFNIRSANGLATAVVTITLADATAAGTYTVTLTDVTSATDSQSLIKFATTSADAVIAAPHVHNFVPTVTKEATCEEDGVKTFACECGKDTYTEAIPAIGHKWDEGVVTTAPDCDDAGVKTYTCANDASHTKTEAINALGHTPGEPAEENRVEAKPGVAGSYDMVVRCTVCNAELSKTTHEIPALPTGPILDETLSSAITRFDLQITNKFNFYVALNLRTVEHDSFELVFEKKELNGKTYAYTGEVLEQVFDATNALSNSYPQYSLYYYTYAGIALYEMNTEITYTLYIERDGITYYYTWEPTTLSAELNKYYNKNINDAVKRTTTVDLLNLGTTAQTYFANLSTTSADSPLKTWGAPNADVNQEYASEAPNLSKIDGIQDTPTVTLSLRLTEAPGFWYYAKLTATQVGKTYSTPSDLTFTARYNSLGMGEQIRSINGAELTADEGVYGKYGLYYFDFSQIALYDVDKVVTFTIEASDGTKWTYQESLESFLVDQINRDDDAGAVYRSLAAFAAGARNFWPDYFE